MQATSPGASLTIVLYSARSEREEESGKGGGMRQPYKNVEGGGGVGERGYSKRAIPSTTIATVIVCLAVVCEHIDSDI